MATQLVYVAEGTAYTFKASGGTVLLTPTSIALANGRISAVWNRGASPRPVRYKWRLQSRWVATPAADDELRLYLITSNVIATANATDGALTFGDATLTSEGPLIRCSKFLGSVTSSGVDQAECSSSIVEIYDQYIGFAVWNGSATKALSATAGDHVLELREQTDQVQSAV